MDRSLLQYDLGHFNIHSEEASKERHSFQLCEHSVRIGISAVRSCKLPIPQNANGHPRILMIPYHMRRSAFWIWFLWYINTTIGIWLLLNLNIVQLNLLL